MIEAILWLVINIYYEANLEPLPAQIAVVQVVMNRADWEPENVPSVILRRKQFSWTSDRGKIKRARKIMKSKMPPDEMKSLIRVVYRAMSVPFYERPVWTHYQVPGSSQGWTCWPGGVTTATFSGAGHVFCGDIDVVRPGYTPAYIKKRAKRRTWRIKKREAN